MQQIFNYFRIKDQKLINDGGRIGRYHMVIGFKTTYVINAYHHSSCECESRSWRCVLDTTLCHTVFQ